MRLPVAAAGAVSGAADAETLAIAGASGDGMLSLGVAVAELAVAAPAAFDREKCANPAATKIPVQPTMATATIPARRRFRAGAQPVCPSSDPDMSASEGGAREWGRRGIT
jgi:hypothetical protein